MLLLSEGSEFTPHALILFRLRHCFSAVDLLLIKLLCSMPYAYMVYGVYQWWGKIYLILNILNKYRIIIIICLMGYLFIYIIPKQHEIVFKYIPI